MRAAAGTRNDRKGIMATSAKRAALGTGASSGIGVIYADRLARRDTRTWNLCKMLLDNDKDINKKTGSIPVRLGPNSAEDQGYGPRFVGAEASHPAAIAGPVRGGLRR